MSGPLAGVRVVELGHFAAAPACAAVLADWGASVVKVEPLAGERSRGPGRRAMEAGLGVTGGADSPRFVLHNRGKRGLAADLASPGGRAVVAPALLRWADVFVTNLRPAALDRLGMAPSAVLAAHPRLVYGQITTFGTGHPSENRPSYDHGAFWARGGVSSSGRPGGDEPAAVIAGLGDRAAALALAGGVAAALYGGGGRYVGVSLFGTALWLQGSDVADLLALGRSMQHDDRTTARKPTLNRYQTGDGRWFWLMLAEPGRHWPTLLRALDDDGLRADPRWATALPDELPPDDAVDLIAELDRIFATADLAHWMAVFEEYGVWYEPVLTVAEAVADPLATASGAIVDGVLASPCAFGGVASGSAPAVGEHSREVLLDVGLGEDDIASLLNDGSIV